MANKSADIASNQSSGQTEALALFTEMARRVPAYQDFLRKQGVKPEQITKPADFAAIPSIDKKNYLTQYPLADLCWDGDLFENRIIAASSGSSGTTFFWPRGDVQDEEGGWMHERIYRHIFGAHEKSTLVVVCFSMGTWIAGSFTTASTIRAAEAGCQLNLITPGIERDEALKAVKYLASSYDQVILAAYPPFIKDVVDAGPDFGIDWSKLTVRFLFAGENLSEEWRDHVLGLVQADDPYHSSANIYGTADAAILAHETPVSIALRRIYLENRQLAEDTFQNSVMPTLVQYYPDRRFFESVDGELVFTARAGLPLVRYNIHDTGGIYSFNELVTPVVEAFTDTASSHNIDIGEWRQPFVYVHGRKDFTATLYAVLIYPENIKAALLNDRIKDLVTGKFTMATKYYSDMDQYLEINVELAESLASKPEEVELVTDVILYTLESLNAEYKKLRASVGQRATPRVQLIEKGNPEYFARGIKHRWKKD